MKKKTTTTRIPHSAELATGLRHLRAKAAELGNYSPKRPTIQLSDSYLELTLQKSDGGGELCGCWIIYRHFPDGRRVGHRAS
jgi:hypothetical protein